MIQIKQATIKDLDTVAPLFDAYRVFYKEASNLADVKAFLTQRLNINDSIIYLAQINNQVVGFTQLYPLFSSVSLQPILLLNDLYVDRNYRNKGIGEALISKAKAYCKDHKLKGLSIQTALDNPAQHLYQRLGFIKDTDLQFFWSNE
ncbi:GNAT family N-acetyltransferase [Hanstruepera ponticola]|uniref:GNAT family N-acetyltransferase n=1 Tax=Hanstruepera ponticola TaxID=2042995 RepID=UPI002936EB1D|nr:GNAT family N-acetyltransferase [Hanstruepera ponticola]